MRCGVHSAGGAGDGSGRLWAGSPEAEPGVAGDRAAPVAVVVVVVAPGRSPASSPARSASSAVREAFS